MITARDVTKQFGDDAVISHLSFDVPPATIVGLVGPSGCGKTTIIRLMMGSLAPTSGELFLNGVPPSELTRSDRRHIGYLPQLPVLFQGLTVWGNVNFHASMYGVRFRRRRRLYEMLDFVDLTSDRRKRVRDASGGMQRRVALAAALVHDPDVVFLDEPTAGIDPILRQRFWEHFRDLRDQGRTLVVSTQYVGEAAHCDLVAVLARGHLVAMDRPDDLRRLAYGGQLVDVTFPEAPPAEVAQGLARFPGATGPLLRPDAYTIRMVVQDAATVIAKCVRWLEGQQITGVTCQEHVPDMDDAFVRLIEADETSRAATHGAEP